MSNDFNIKGRIQVDGGEYIGAGTETQTINKKDAAKLGIKAKEFDSLVERGVFLKVMRLLHQ